MGEKTADDMGALKKFSNVVLATSIFFWVWALVNIITKNIFDLGIISFFTTFLSSLYLMLRVPKNGLSLTGRNLVSLTHLFVAINYALGFVIAFSLNGMTFGIYCAIFTILWLLVLCRGYFLMAAVMSES